MCAWSSGMILGFWMQRNCAHYDLLTFEERIWGHDSYMSTGSGSGMSVTVGVGLKGMSRSGCPCCAAMAENKGWVINWFLTTKHKTWEMCARVEIGFNALETIVDNLWQRKFCAKWIPGMITPDHKVQRVQTCADFLEQYESMGDDFLDSIAGNETRYSITNRSQSSSVWSGDARTRQQRRNSRLIHPLKKPCVPSFGKREGLFLWISWKGDMWSVLFVMWRHLRSWRHKF